MSGIFYGNEQGGSFPYRPGGDADPDLTAGEVIEAIEEFTRPDPPPADPYRVLPAIYHRDKEMQHWLLAGAAGVGS